MVQIADKFKSKRKELKLSQKALADGICEQSQISKLSVVTTCHRQTSSIN